MRATARALCHIQTEDTTYLRAALEEAGVIFTARGVKLIPSPGRKSARAAERRQGRVKAMTTGAQIRAARELLGWRQAELAKRARIQAHSVESAESSLGQSFVPGQDMQAMRAVLEAAGVEFTDGEEPGVKLKATKARKGK
jgi:ribosome-binding protein aMBF1 (putative translation factor)